MTGELIAICILFLVVCMQYYLQISERNCNREKEKELLDRIMSRNYETYAQVELSKEEQVQDERLTPEEYLAKYGEEGLPVI